MTTNMNNSATPRADVMDAKIKRSKTSAIVGKIVVYAVLVLYAIIIILPFLIILLTSLRDWIDASSIQFQIIPERGFNLEGYAMVFDYYANMDAALPTIVSGFINTLVYVLPPTILGLLTSSLAAYAFAKLRFRAKNFLYSALLATMMIPGTITIAPQFSIYDAIGWIDTPWPLMIPGMFGAAACVFFMRQFFTGIPDSVIESAKLDGVGFIGIFFKIVAPLSVPALLAQGLLGFIGGYNDYFGPKIYLQSSELYTLQVALRNFADSVAGRPNAAMAGTIVALVPTLIVYFFTQNYFVEGIAASGIKG